MNRTLLTLLALVFSAGLFAQTSKVSVFSQNGERFWVVINGIRQNDKPQTNVKVEGLDQPNYKVRIIFEDEKIPAIDKMIMTRDVDNKATYCTYVVRRNKKGEMIMPINSYQPLENDNNQNRPADQTVVAYRTNEQTNNVLFGMNVNGAGVNVNTNGGNGTRPGGGTTQTNQTTTTQTTQTTTTTNGNPTNGGGIGININDPVTGQNVGVNMNVNMGGMNMNTNVNGSTTTTTTTTTTTSGTSNNNVQQQQTTQTQPRPQGCVFPVGGTDFNNMKSSLEKQSFEETKLKMAKDIMRRNCYSTAQIKEMMGLFSFEESKLDLAKYAYDFCTDKNNYYMLNDAFSFSSSVEDLTEFLSKK
jgi:hypothetical protein